jgi:hypothetical protein
MHPHTKYHWPISKDKNVMARTRKYYLKNIIWLWGQRSRSHKGHYGIQHTAFVGPWPLTTRSNNSNKFNKKYCLLIIVPLSVASISFTKYVSIHESLVVKGQGPTKVITVCDTPTYDHAPTYQILTYLERQKCYGPDKKILFKVLNNWHEI